MMNSIPRNFVVRVSETETPKLMDEVRRNLRAEGYALKTERTYMHWIRKYVRYHLPAHPRAVGIDGVNKYLTHLAADCSVAPPTQNQCRAALLFLYKLLGIDLGRIDAVIAKKDKRVPTVLTVDEALQVISNLRGVYRIIGELLYGGGLRLNECLSLRVKDLDLFSRTITLHDTKGNADRVTCLPMAAIPALQLHLGKVEAIHREDLANGYGEVELPYSLARKYSRAAWEFGWQYVFPASGLSRDPRSSRVGRHHIFETTVQRAVKAAARMAGISKPVGPHTFRHCFATHLLKSGENIKTVQELLGHKDIKTTLVYIHIAGASEVQSPLDRFSAAYGIKQRVLVEL